MWIGHARLTHGHLIEKEKTLIGEVYGKTGKPINKKTYCNWMPKI